MKTDIGKQYCVTSDSECEIVDTATNKTIHLHHAGEGQSYFTAIGLDSEPSDDSAIITPTFNGATAGNGSGGGYIESNLNVGHGAADAVAAVCTLTLGDPTEEGTLADNAGHELHLDAAPATYAHDFWGMPHPTDGGVLVVGDHTFTEVEEKAAANAYGYWPNEAGSYSSPPIELRRLADPENPAGEYEVLWESLESYGSDEEFVAAFNSEQGFAEAEISELEETPFLITAKGDYAGAEGNRLVLVSNGGEFYVTQLSGGQDARTLEEALELAVSTINDDEDSPIRAEVGEDAQGNKGIAVYALEAGSGHNYDCWQTTGLFFAVNTSMAYDGEDARTLDEVAAAITAEDSDFADEVVVTHASGASTLTLTAATAGKAANAIVYTSTGCFGGEKVKQGSTTRGKDAVEQTAFKIFLNGEVLDVEPAPTPEELEEDTAMKNHGVYLVTADATAQDFTGITLADNATAEIWLTCTSDDNSVALPGSTEGWIWLDAMPDMEAGKTYAVAARNVGNAVLARPIYEYTTPAES